MTWSGGLAHGREKVILIEDDSSGAFFYSLHLVF